MGGAPGRLRLCAPIKPTLAAVIVLALSLAVPPLGSSARADSTVLQDPAPRALDAAAVAAVLNPIREKHAVAAIAGAIVTSRGLQAAGVVGLRKAGTEVAATIDDRWHLGSDTKAMTAALLGRLVERGLLKWETKPAEVFPELAAGFDPGYADVTVLHLLSHRAGLQANLDWGASAKAGALPAQRLDAVKKGFAAPPLHAPGSRLPLLEPRLRDRRCHRRAPARQDLGGGDRRGGLRTAGDQGVRIRRHRHTRPG